MKRTERAELAVKRHEAGEPVSAIARDLGISTAAVYRAIKRRQEWADAERAHAEKIRADAHNLSNEAQRADLAIRREAIEALPRGRALDGSAWVNLADVLRLLVQRDNQTIEILNKVMHELGLCVDPLSS